MAEKKQCASICDECVDSDPPWDARLGSVGLPEIHQLLSLEASCDTALRYSGRPSCSWVMYFTHLVEAIPLINI